MTTRPVVFPGGRFVIAATLAGALGTSGWVISSGGTTPLLVLAGLSLLFGVLFVLPVGGADVPIVISLLNAFTGLTVAASGYVLQSTLLIVAGTLVGASGTILTRKMAAAGRGGGGGGGADAVCVFSDWQDPPAHQLHQREACEDDERKVTGGVRTRVYHIMS